MSSGLKWQNSAVIDALDAAFSTGHWTSVRVRYIKQNWHRSIEKEVTQTYQIRSFGHSDMKSLYAGLLHIPLFLETQNLAKAKILR